MDFSKNILVVGTGISGKGVIELLRNKGANFDIYGQKQKLKNYDYAVVSAGIPMKNKIVKKFSKQTKIIGELEIVQNELRGINIAVTGTNGKTTTTYLVEHIVEQSGKRATAMGNCGIAIDPSETHDGGVNVIEVSSFMMEKSPDFGADIAVLTNLCKEHVEHHGSVDAYYSCKINLLNNSDIIVVNADCIESLRQTTNIDNGKKIFFGMSEHVDGAYIKDGVFCFMTQPICSVNQTQLLGNHNMQNILAAICVAKLLGIENTYIANGIRSFLPVRHRLSFVASINDVKYINDSKATNISSMINAVDSVVESKILILGGSSKGEDFSKIDFKDKNIKKIVCYGYEGKRIAKQIKFAKENIIYTKKFRAAVMVASGFAISHDTVLLSPACASFDQHKNFEHRGEEFENIVKVLANKSEHSNDKN